MISTSINRFPDYWAGGTLEDYQFTDYKSNDILGDVLITGLVVPYTTIRVLNSGLMWYPRSLANRCPNYWVGKTLGGLSGY